MSDDWFHASLIEIGDWLNKFEHQEAVIVNPDDEIVAACVQVLVGVHISRVAWQRVLSGMQIMRSLDEPPPPA